MLNHWDNLDRTFERGYAGLSICDWHLLPCYVDPRYEAYARANASIGINAFSLTNMNVNALILTIDFMKKVKKSKPFQTFWNKGFPHREVLSSHRNRSTADPLCCWWARVARDNFDRRC